MEFQFIQLEKKTVLHYVEKNSRIRVKVREMEKGYSGLLRAAWAGPPKQRCPTPSTVQNKVQRLRVVGSYLMKVLKHLLLLV